MAQEQDAPESQHRSPQQVRQEFATWGRTTGEHIKSGDDTSSIVTPRRVLKLSSALCEYMQQAQARFCYHFRCCPFLIHCESDASSHLTAFRKSFRQTDQGPALQRGGHDLCEFLSERTWMATQFNASQLNRSLLLIKPASLLREGEVGICA